jgi:hypothetical protein
VPDLRLPGQVKGCPWTPPAPPCCSLQGLTVLCSPIFVRPRQTHGLQDFVHSAFGSSPEDFCSHNETAATWSFRLSWYAHQERY